MRKLTLWNLKFVGIALVLSLSTGLRAEDHANSGSGNGGSSSGSRSTNDFSGYETLQKKLQTWAASTSGAKDSSMDGDKFTVQLDKAQMTETAEIVGKLKWYRSQIKEHCETSDNSAKALGEYIDRCVAPGYISEAVEDAQKVNNRWAITVDHRQMAACKKWIGDYYRRKQTLAGANKSKFMTDWQMLARTEKLFAAFSPTTEQLAGYNTAAVEVAATSELKKDGSALVTALDSVNKNNLCQISDWKGGGTYAYGNCGGKKPCGKKAWTPKKTWAKKPAYTPKAYNYQPDGYQYQPQNYQPQNYQPQNYGYDQGNYSPPAGGYGGGGYVPDGGNYGGGGGGGYAPPPAVAAAPVGIAARPPIGVGVAVGPRPYPPPPPMPPILAPLPPPPPPPLVPAGVAVTVEAVRKPVETPKSVVGVNPLMDPMMMMLMMQMQKRVCVKAPCPQVPGMPGLLPGMPGGGITIPGFPNIPGYPSIPGMPTTPGFFGQPTSPNIGYLPRVPGSVNPFFPQFPTIPGNPTNPTNPGIPTPTPTPSIAPYNPVPIDRNSGTVPRV